MYSIIYMLVGCFLLIGGILATMVPDMSAAYIFGGAGIVTGLAGFVFMLKGE